MHFDWSTLALQTINVVVLIWLLARFLFRPVRAIIDQRRAAAEQLLADAARVRANAETAAAGVQAQMQGASAAAGQVLAQSRELAEKERGGVLEQAGEAAAQMRRDASAAIEIDRGTMEQALRRRAGDLAVVIARRLVMRLPAKAATAALLEALATAVAELPEAARGELADGGEVEIVTAVPLDDDQRTACQAMLGAPASVRFRTDPDLLAGVELHTPGLLIRDSWRADLERIAAELNPAN